MSTLLPDGAIQPAELIAFGRDGLVEVKLFREYISHRYFWRVYVNSKLKPITVGVKELASYLEVDARAEKIERAIVEVAIRCASKRHADDQGIAIEPLEAGSVALKLYREVKAAVEKL